MRPLFLLIFTAALAFGTITSNGTGGGAYGTGSTWQGGVAPVATDPVIVLATDSVVWSGNTSRSADTTAFGSLLMDATAAISYTWTQTGASTLTLSGASNASRATWGLTNGTTPTGVITGKFVANLATIDHCGPAAGTSLAGGNANTQLTYTTVSNSAPISPGSIPDGANWIIDGVKFVSPTNANKYVIQFGNVAQSTPTSGTRRIAHVFCADCSIFWAGNLPVGATPRIFVFETYLRRNPGDQQGAITGPHVSSSAPPTFEPGYWHDNFQRQTQEPDDAGAGRTVTSGNMPRDDLGYMIALTDTYQAGVQVCRAANPHVVYSGHQSDVHDWIVQSACLGGGQSLHGGHFWLLASADTNEAPGYTITLRNILILPPLLNTGTPALVNITGALTANPPAISVYNVTYPAKQGVGDGTCQIPIGGETNGAAAGLYPIVQRILAWLPASAQGCLTSMTKTVKGTTGAFGVVGDNFTYQMLSMTGAANSTFYQWGAQDLYSSVPGANDRSGNPLWTDTTRDWLTWGKSLDPAVTTWDDIEAHFADLDNPAHDQRWSIRAAFDWIRAGWTPQNSATWTSATGGYVGGAPPPAIFPMPGSSRRGR